LYNDQVQIQLQANQAGIQLIHHTNILPKQQPKGDATASESPEKDLPPAVSATNTNSFEDVGAITAEANSLFTESNSTTDSTANKGTAGLSSNVKKGTEVKLPNMHIGDQIGTMTIKSALLIVQCGRCRTRCDFKIFTKQYSFFFFFIFL